MNETKQFEIQQVYANIGYYRAQQKLTFPRIIGVFHGETTVEAVDQAAKERNIPAFLLIGIDVK